MKDESQRVRKVITRATHLHRCLSISKMDALSAWGGDRVLFIVHPSSFIFLVCSFIFQ